MNSIEQFITEDSAIYFTNGQKVVGAKEVSESILECCRSYNAGYIEGRNQIVKGALIGGLVMGVVITVTNKIVEHRKKTQK